MRISIVVLALAAGAVRADGGIPFEVELGKTVERDVAAARGWFCDEPSLVKAELVTRGDRNFWIVSGVKLGSTQCRVGTDVHRVYYVFDVSVVKPKR